MLHEYERVEVLAANPDWIFLFRQQDRPSNYYRDEISAKTSDALAITFVATIVLLFLSLTVLAWGTVKVSQSAAMANQSPIPTQVSGWEKLK